MGHKPAPLLLVALTATFLLALLNSASGSKNTVSELLGRRFRFESKNYQGYYMCHSGYRMQMDTIRTDQDRLDSAFDIVPGLNGVGVSFRSLNYPGHYIRHRGYYCYIDRYEDRDLYRDDASFLPRGGLADSANGVSFESSNYQGHYIRHSGYRLRIEQLVGEQLFREDATWYPTVLQQLSSEGKWELLFGIDNSQTSGQFTRMVDEGVSISASETETVTRENSWRASIETEASGQYKGFAASLKAMYETSSSVSVTTTSTNSWTKQQSVEMKYQYNLVQGQPFYLWQFQIYMTTSDETYISSKTNLFMQTAGETPPYPASGV